MLHCGRKCVPWGSSARNPSLLLELLKLTVLHLPKPGIHILMVVFGGGVGLCGPIIGLAMNGNGAGAEGAKYFYEQAGCSG